MRAEGKDIVEIFGYQPDDISSEARSVHLSSQCPFVGGLCSKRNSDQTVVYGVCSVTNGIQKEPGTEVIICPKRLYANYFNSIRNVSKEVWGDLPFLIGGTKAELKEQALSHDESVVAFGQGSGNEVSVPGEARLSMDWVIQKYRRENGRLIPIEFVGIEVQSIDITDNYRDCHASYTEARLNEDPEVYIPNSIHGLNWANVHKRLIPQILRKGNIYQDIERCKGFYFILPDAVFKKFEDILGEMPKEEGPRKDNLSVHTYILGEEVPAGKVRGLILQRSTHFPLSSIHNAFTSRKFEEVAENFDKKLKEFLL